jgi:hypothetical protein
MDLWLINMVILRVILQKIPNKLGVNLGVKSKGIPLKTIQLCLDNLAVGFG